MLYVDVIRCNLFRCHILRQYVVGSFACIGGGLFGLDISSMSGVLNVSLNLFHFHFVQVRLTSE